MPVFFVSTGLERRQAEGSRRLSRLPRQQLILAVRRRLEQRRLLQGLVRAFVGQKSVSLQIRIWLQQIFDGLLLVAVSRLHSAIVD